MKMKKLVIGILAHVDAGKTTLSEGMLYLSGAIRKLGRVDNKDAFLDTFEIERNRGITVFSKQAILNIGNTEVTPSTDLANISRILVATTIEKDNIVKVMAIVNNFSDIYTAMTQEITRCTNTISKEVTPKSLLLEEFV